MPAAAVIPAPIAYIKAAAVKKLVVGSGSRARGPPGGGTARPALPSGVRVREYHPLVPFVAVSRGGRNFYFEKIRVLKAGLGA